VQQNLAYSIISMAIRGKITLNFSKLARHYISTIR